MLQSPRSAKTQGETLYRVSPRRIKIIIEASKNEACQSVDQKHAAGLTAVLRCTKAVGRRIKTRGSKRMEGRGKDPVIRLASAKMGLASTLRRIGK